MNLGVLEQYQPCRDSCDGLIWIPGTAGILLVNSAYKHLQNRYAMVDIDAVLVKVLQQLWFNNSPLKVNIFGWRLLLKKLPTRKIL
jgi:hypothetical protein